MNLQFESLAELKSFLSFVATYRTENAVPICVGEGVHELAVQLVTEHHPEAGVVVEQHALPTEQAPITSTRKPRAKRSETAAATTETASTGDAPDNAVAGAVANTAAVVGPFATEVDIKNALSRRANELGNDVDAAKHLDASRAFIAAKGLPSYFRTQALAGVGDNAITYTPQDRALHTAAMEYFTHLEHTIPPGMAAAA